MVKHVMALKDAHFYLMINNAKIVRLFTLPVKNYAFIKWVECSKVKGLCRNQITNAPPSKTSILFTNWCFVLTNLSFVSQRNCKT